MVTRTKLPGQPMLLLSRTKSLLIGSQWDAMTTIIMQIAMPSTVTQRRIRRPEFVDQEKVHNREDEVGSRYGDGNGSGIAETEKTKQSGAVLHQGVEATKLGNGHDDASSENSSSGSWSVEDTVEGGKECFALHGCGNLVNGHLN